MALVDAAKHAYGHIERAVLLIEPARRLELRHLGLGRDVHLDAALDQLLLFVSWLLEIDPGRPVRNLLELRIDDASVAVEAVSAQHARLCRPNAHGLQGERLC